MPKKIRIAKLVSSGGTTNDPAVIINLRQDQEAMATGLMGGCCSAIFLWNRGNDDRYQNMRGHHADADPGNIDWADLVDNVPNDPQQTKLIIACAKDNLDGDFGYRQKVLQALQAEGDEQILFSDGRPCSIEPSFYGFPDVLVFRNGIVIELNGNDYSAYDVG